MKICASCGREIEPRKKWAKDWDQVKFCSDSCRRNKSRPSYEKQILDLLEKRGSGKTICPSEVLPEDQKQSKEIMEDVRSSARKLAADGKIQFMQKGQRVDPSRARGPIRLKLLRK